MRFKKAEGNVSAAPPSSSNIRDSASQFSAACSYAMAAILESWDVEIERIGSGKGRRRRNGVVDVDSRRL